MNQIIKSPSVNFEELVKSTSSSLSLNIQTEMIKNLNDEFTENEQKWYIANLYVYMNYHPTDEYPINLENVYKMIGFANKGNAIKSNFIEDLGGAGLNRETPTQVESNDSSSFHSQILVQKIFSIII